MPGKQDWAAWFKAAPQSRGNGKGRLWESECAWVYVSGCQPAHSDPAWFVTSGERAGPVQDQIILHKLLFLKINKCQPTHSMPFLSRVQKDTCTSKVCNFSSENVKCVLILDFFCPQESWFSQRKVLCPLSTLLLLGLLAAPLLHFYQSRCIL